MKPKREKTEFGTIVPIVPRKKNVRYGDVVAPVVRSEKEDGKLPEGSGKDASAGEISGSEGTSSASSSEAYEKMVELLEKIEKAEAEKEEQESKEDESGETSESPEKSEKGEEKSDGKSDGDESGKNKGDDSEEKGENGDEKKDDESKGKPEEEKDKDDKKEEKEKSKEDKKQKEKEYEMLTKYLTLQLRIRALGEIFGSIVITKKDTVYYSFGYIEGSTGPYVTENRFVTDGRALYLEEFPFFESKEKAEAFLQLLETMIIDYMGLKARLQAQEVAVTPIKVIHS